MKRLSVRSRLMRFYPELINHALVCVTETTTRADILRFASELRTAAALAREQG